MLKDLCRRKTTQVLRDPSPLAGTLGPPWGQLGAVGDSPVGMPTFDRCCRSQEPASPSLLLRDPLGSAGLRYVNMGQITFRERTPALVNKSQVRPGLCLWRRTHCSPAPFTEQGICPAPGGTRDPLSRALESGHRAVAKAESSLLALLLRLDALCLLWHSRVHFLFRLKTLECKWSVLIDLKRLNFK